MNLLLYSSYKCMPNTEIKNVLGKFANKTCLFCSYADEKAISYINKEKGNLTNIFDEIIDLTPDYNFKDKIDCIFVSGGNIFELIYKLKKYNQFNKIKELVESGILYIGNSAGSWLCGTNNLYINNYEPPKIDMNVNEYCEGFGFIKSAIFVHASKYAIDNAFTKIKKENDYIHYLHYKKIFTKYIAIPNNGVAIVKNDNIKIKKYSWKNIIKQHNKI